jgi:hypothetical protein
MNHVRLLLAVATLATFGLILQGEVPSVVADDSYNLGLVESEVCPEDKGDTLVVYSAKWCGPCQVMRAQWPVLRGQGYKVVYIDIDDPYNQVGRFDYVTTTIVDKAMEKRPRSVPTMRYYNSDAEKFLKEKVVGMQSLDKIKERLWKPSSSTVLVPEF